MKNEEELDVDNEYDITTIKEVIYDHEEGSKDGNFYILTNKFEEKLGFFILKLDQ